MRLMRASGRKNREIDGKELDLGRFGRPRSQGALHKFLEVDPFQFCEFTDIWDVEKRRVTGSPEWIFCGERAPASPREL